MLQLRCSLLILVGIAVLVLLTSEIPLRAQVPKAGAGAQRSQPLVPEAKPDPETPILLESLFYMLVANTV